MLELLSTYLAYTIGFTLRSLSIKAFTDPKDIELDFYDRLTEYSNILKNQSHVNTIFSNFREVVNFGRVQSGNSKLSDTEILDEFMKDIFSPSILSEISPRRSPRFELWTTFLKSVITSIKNEMKPRIKDIHLPNFQKLLYDQLNIVIQNVRTQFAYKVSAKLNNLPETEIESNDRINGAQLIQENIRLKKQISDLMSEIEQLKGKSTRVPKPTQEKSQVSTNESVVVSGVCDLDDL